MVHQQRVLHHVLWPWDTLLWAWDAGKVSDARQPEGVSIGGQFSCIKSKECTFPKPKIRMAGQGVLYSYINRGQRRAMHYMAWNFAGQMTQQCRSAVQKLSCMKIRWTSKANDKSYSEEAEADCITAVLRMALAPNLCMQGNILC